MAIFLGNLALKQSDTALSCNTVRFGDRLGQDLAGAISDSPERTCVVMSLKGLRSKFSSSIKGALVSSVALTGLAFNAAAEDGEAPKSPSNTDIAKVHYSELGLCTDYEKHKTKDFELGGYGSAIQFSEDKNHDIGIYVSPSTDIPPEQALAVAEKAASLHRGKGLVAKCFLGPENNRGVTKFASMVNGLPIPEKVNFQNATAFINSIQAVEIQAKLVREAGIKGDPRYLLSSVGPDLSNE